MRASRLLAILMLLQARGRMTAEALAAEFEVSVRTIYRDIDQLSAADIPVYGDRGPSGGFALLDGYRTKLTGLTPAEAETLFLAGLPGPAAELGLGGVLAAAQLKLTAALPERARASAHRVAERVHLDPVGWFRSAEDARLLPVIAQAVWTETYLDVRYKMGASSVSRRLKPLGLVLKAGVWYLVAQVREQTRTYRISQMLEAAPSDEHFARPRDFDLAAAWTAAAQAYERGVYRDKAVLRVSPKAMTRLDMLGSRVARAASETAGPPGQDGWWRLTIPIESIDQAAADLIRLGTAIEVLEPAALRRGIADLAQAVTGVYRGPSRASPRRRT
ncbi:MAG TPA: YafY family protein [Stellaceae bacterium]|nr:YafY family protein [Stellaceae bacterium]